MKAHSRIFSSFWSGVCRSWEDQSSDFESATKEIFRIDDDVREEQILIVLQNAVMNKGNYSCLIEEKV